MLHSLRHGKYQKRQQEPIKSQTLTRRWTNNTADENKCFFTNTDKTKQIEHNGGEKLTPVDLELKKHFNCVMHSGAGLG